LIGIHDARQEANEMTHTVQVVCARTVDGEELLAAFAAQGLSGELVDRGPQLVFRLADAGRDAAQFTRTVIHSLDAWLGERRLPLVPVRLAEDAFALRPPAA
jgi:hypothetical protein